MMTYSEIYTNAIQAENVNRLAVAVAKYAVTVYGESGGVDSHAERVLLLNHAGPRTRDYERFAEEIAIQTFSFGVGIDENSSDADFLSVVETLWTPLALLYIDKGLIEVVVP